MKKILSIGAALLVSIMLCACTTSERKDTGMLAGGVIGGVAGHALTGGSTAGTIIGAVGGGYVGRQVAH